MQVFSIHRFFDGTDAMHSNNKAESAVSGANCNTLADEYNYLSIIWICI